MSKGWVCPICGLDYDTISKRDAALAVRSYPRRFRDALATVDDPAVLRRRPSPDVWSALEYTAHVRDMFALMADTVERMVREDHPTISFPDPDERAGRERYNRQPVDAVLEGLQANAVRFADVIDSVTVDDLTRTARFPWGERDVLTMIRNGVHEGHHHLRDVELVLERLGARRRDDD
jgi:hypothetical protein